MRYIHGHNGRGKRNAAWKGGRKQNWRGYWFVWMPDHHLAHADGYVPEHRIVWEEANGKRLEPSQHVHHLDGDPSNNAPENLVALTARAHQKLEATSPNGRKNRSRAATIRNADPRGRKATSERMKRVWAERKRG